MSKLKFVIVSPPQGSGGSIALHALCKYLQDEGYNSKIFYIGPDEYKPNKKFKFWKEMFIFKLKDKIKQVLFLITRNKKYIKNKTFPVKGCKEKFWPFVDKKTIVVYPEIVYGNFLKAKKVVRWLLYHNKYVDDKNAFGKDDLFICFREVFNDANLNPEGNQLHVAYFNLDLYKRTNFEEREGTCYIVRKGENREDLPEKFDGPIVDNLSEEEKVKMFNKCKYCVSYDTQTAYATISAICGCVSIVVPEKGKTREDYLSNNETIYGVSYGFEKKEIEWAQNTQAKAKERYEKINNQGREAVKQFVELCKQKFKNKG